MKKLASLFGGGKKDDASSKGDAKSAAQAGAGDAKAASGKPAEVSWGAASQRLDNDTLAEARARRAEHARARDLKNPYSGTDERQCELSEDFHLAICTGSLQTVRQMFEACKDESQRLRLLFSVRKVPSGLLPLLGS